MKYVIDYCNGFTEEVECSNLDSAKTLAVEGMRYTQCDVKIKSEGKLLATSYWHGSDPSDDEIVLERFGTYGYYGDWNEEW